MEGMQLPDKTNGSALKPEPEVAADPQDRIKELEAQLKQAEINRLLERRSSLMGWAIANQYQLQEVISELAKLGWKPTQ